ncbi:MAG TPA: hypothetical protein VFB13_15865 [Reyranella sp.]|nr:hypothetical protein [Reyranella sp.]
MPSRAFAQGIEQFEVGGAETATIDGRQWDKPMPGGMTVDAVHRSVLLRFPKAADEIARLLRKGRVLMKAEIALRYGGYEIVPQGYLCRDGLGRPRWTSDPPTWHVTAVALRHPWKSDEATGPTYNASVNGRRYWSHFGAEDLARDRFDGLIDPQELSVMAREARLDITRLLATPVTDHDAGERLRRLEQCGFLLRKLETYDTRYRSPGDAYEWAMPTGGHGLSFTSPRLLLSCRRLSNGGIVSIVLPPGMESDWEIATKDGSRPTAVMPTPQQVVELARRVTRVAGPPRPPWELAHIDELHKVGGDGVSGWADVAGDKGYKNYQDLVRNALAMPPRYWVGWEIEDILLTMTVFRPLLPAPVLEHYENYWRAWLQPDLPTSAFVAPHSQDAVDYWQRYHDWRGRASFFRGGYNYIVSTQNFNHTAAMGALLGGAQIGAQNAIVDGRHGLEHLLLRFWGFLDGSTQELLDPYYLSITLSAQKMFADYGPTPVDRLMGRILTDRTMELLTSCYHPQLRRLVSSANRARLSGLLVEQDGIYGALHTVSKEGAVKYLDQPFPGKVHGMPAWGYDFPPGRVATQSLAAPWAPSWLSGLIDNKPVPFDETATDTTRNNFRPPLWRRTYLGRWHGLASADIKGGTVDVMAQWVRQPRKSTTLEDLGTLTVRYAANTPNLVTTSGGVTPQAGLTLTFQSRNRAIVFAKPHGNRQRFLDAAGKEVSRLATVIGLWDFSASPSWEIFVDDRKVTSFPLRAKVAQRILIRDGVTYLAILPLPAADLGRDIALEIGPGGGGKADPTGAEISPALILSLFNMRRDKPVPAGDLDFAAIGSRTYGGFVLELGDAEQHGSFDKFVQHIKQNELKAEWNESQRHLAVAYRSGGDLMEAGFGTEFGQPDGPHYVLDPGQQERAIAYRKLNGQWPYLAAGVERDTSWSQQGTTGRLEKNGAVLISEEGRKAYLLADPVTGAVVGYNPLPDPQTWKLTTKDGTAFSADGKLALLRVEWRPWARELDIAHTPKTDQKDPDLAKNFIIEGMNDPPKVTLNGKPVEPRRGEHDFQVALS